MSENKREEVEGLLVEYFTIGVNETTIEAGNRASEKRERILSIVEELEKENGELKAEHVALKGKP